MSQPPEPSVKVRRGLTNLAILVERELQRRERQRLPMASSDPQTDTVALTDSCETLVAAIDFNRHNQTEATNAVLMDRAVASIANCYELLQSTSTIERDE